MTKKQYLFQTFCIYNQTYYTVKSIFDGMEPYVYIIMSVKFK